MNNNKDVNILIVDDRPENLLVLESLLENMDCNIVKASSGNEALGLMFEYDFALVLMDVQMPEMDGFETAEIMRSSLRTKYIPIIFVTAISKEQRCIFQGYEVGAVDYLFKPIEPIILQSKVRIFIELYNQRKQVQEQKALLELKVKELTELQKTNSELKTLSTRDGLTGIPNRRGFDQYAEMTWRNSIRSDKPISLIMADIDYFKLYNDNYGHLKGDDCLIQVAASIESSVQRPLDFAARYGGEEFSVILPETDADGAELVAEKIRKDLLEKHLEHAHSKVLPYVTLSIGVATRNPGEKVSVADLIDLADKALYKAKAMGRNTVCSYREELV
jgi:diguanylate cyclase (GGDEF)-like protein